MSGFLRSDRSLMGAWWRSIDRWILGGIFILIICGITLVSAASPAVAERIGLSPFYFVERHLIFLVPTIIIMIVTSLMDNKTLWRAASLVLVTAMALIIVSILFGVEIKGATRWVHIFGFSLQPSEFAKPSFAITSAWLIARHQYQENFPGHQIATGLFGLVLLLLMLQPDFGMSFVLSSIWASQIFLSGLPVIWVIVLGALGVAGIIGAYTFFPHVASRIDRFLDPASGDNYQIKKSLESFSNGGLLGTGPGHGHVKLTLPDAHADFIFSVAGEEFGLIATVLLVLLFCFIILRCFFRIYRSDDAFTVLAAGGLLTQFSLQSLIHMGSSLQLLPAKGMTLPFISYGGSSLMALGFGVGALLALTRKRTAAPTTSRSRP